MMKPITSLAMLAVTSLISLSACVTASQEDIKLVETGHVTEHVPGDPPDELLMLIGPPPDEPTEDDPPEVWQEWQALRNAWEAHWAELQDVWRISATYRTYHAWGFWATLGKEPLFKVTLNGIAAPEGYWCPIYDACVGWQPHQLSVEIEGTPTGTNPIAGSAIWSGHAHAASRSGRPLTGIANLEADLGAGLIDVHLTELGNYDFSWTRLVMRDGAFARIQGSPHHGSPQGHSIEGWFFGPYHEGAAGKFHRGRIVGVFGTLRTD